MKTIYTARTGWGAGLGWFNTYREAKEAFEEDKYVQAHAKSGGTNVDEMLENGELIIAEIEIG